VAAAVEESELLSATGADFDPVSFLAGTTTPVLFAAAVLNFGVAQLLDALVSIAPSPASRPDAGGAPRPVDAPFSALVFKVQAGMDANHRDRLAYARVCSGRFERGMVVTHAATGRPFATKYAQQVFGRDRSTLDVAYPGDVVGLVNATALRAGDTLFAGPPVTFPPIPSFAPEHFAVCRARDSGRYKQFRRGIEQLDQEASCRCCAPTCAATRRRCSPPSAPCSSRWRPTGWVPSSAPPYACEPLPYALARRTRPEDVATLDAQPSIEVLSRSDGTLLALFPDRWRLQWVLRDNLTCTSSRSSPAPTDVRTSRASPLEPYSDRTHLVTPPHAAPGHTAAAGGRRPARRTARGLGEVGRNMTVFEHSGRLLVVDCGVLFPEETQPGVDVILPTSPGSGSG
jgi:peptide chain release factor 3